MKEINIEELKEILRYEPETGFLYWKIRKETSHQIASFNKTKAGKRAGYLRKNRETIPFKHYGEIQSSRIAWALYHGEWSKKEIDHINGNSADNRIVNLREATRSQNAINRSKQSNNRSGYKGVWKRKNLNSWVAQICVNKKNIRIGSFDSPEKAYAAYVEAAKKYHGEFAKYV